MLATRCSDDELLDDRPPARAHQAEAGAAQRHEFSQPHPEWNDRSARLKIKNAGRIGQVEHIRKTGCVAWGMFTAVCVALYAAGADGRGIPESDRVPPETTAAWVVATPSEVALDAGLIRKAVSELPDEREHGLHSMLIVRHGKLVAEHYWNGYDRDTLQDLRSATKSVTSLLIGIAIDKGKIGSIGDPVQSYLAHAYPRMDAAHGAITIENLLTMRSGLACDDRDKRSPGQEDRMYRSRDWVEHFLTLPISADQGGAAHYCTGGVVTLGRVLAEASGVDVATFAERTLFEPLGIEHVRWSRFDRDRQTDTGGHLYMRPRDLARIGQLIVQRGTWQDQRVVSKAWIDSATREQTHIDDGKSFGYLWWRGMASLGNRRFTAVFALGNGGQLLLVIPELEMVVVFTGGNYNSPKAGMPFDILARYVMPAVLDLSSN